MAFPVFNGAVVETLPFVIYIRPTTMANLLKKIRGLYRHIIKQGVASCRGNLQHPLGGLLAPDFRQAAALKMLLGGRLALVGFQGLLAGEMGRDPGQLVGGQGGGAGQAGFLGVIGGDDEGAVFSQAGKGGGQHAGNGIELAVQRQFANKLVVVRGDITQLPAGDQDAQRNGQIKAAAVFWKVRRGQAYGDAPLGEIKAAVHQRGADPVAALAHGGIP